MRRLSRLLSGMDKKEFESKVYLTYVDRFQIPLGIGLFFIFVESLISDAKPARSRRWFSSLLERRALGNERRLVMTECETPNRANAAKACHDVRKRASPLGQGGTSGGLCWTVRSHGLATLQSSWTVVRHSQIFLLALIFAATTGQIWRDKVSRKNAEGNVLYEQKNFPGALDKYVEANDGKSHRQELAYNLANAFYQQKKYPEALQELEKAIASGNSRLNEKIYFNRGNTFFQMGKYQEAIEAYKKALELDPGDKEAKHNLELALKKLQENPQEQQKDSKNKDQQSKQDKQDKQDQKQDGSQDQQKQQQPSQPKNQQNQPQNANSKPDRIKSSSSRAAAEGRHGSEGSAAYSGRS